MKKRILAAAHALCGAVHGAQSAQIGHFLLITDTHVCDKADQSAAIAGNGGQRSYMLNSTLP